MHRLRNLRNLLFDSCRSKDEAITPPFRRNPTVAADFAADDLSLARETPSYLWRKEEKRLAAGYPRSKIDSHSPAESDGILFPSEMLTASSPESTEFGVGKMMKESTAVVKRSEDPRRDFRRSMVEMVVEKGMYDAGELEELLRCFLSLNSRQHHFAIVAAFADVWEALFSEASGGCR